jgi:threonine/homoserine/homoserine lactone efflux protein
VLASRLRSWFAAAPARSRAVGALGGVSMIGLGIGIAVTGRTE